MDIFLYSGELRRGHDLDFVEFVAENKKSDQLTLILSTPGGAPDAAYKIGRYLQSKYENIIVFVPGFCKSAGTLLAISANELIFSPYGELGPLGIQMTRTDSIGGLDSGLNISEAFLTLENRARGTFHNLVNEITSNSGGVISFQTASHSASEIVASLYGPVFGRIDPEEVGSRARAMRIGEDYGARLNNKFSNLKDNALSTLSQSYSSHGFVIDMQEASILFERVRESNSLEKRLIDKVGNVCRFPNQDIYIKNLTNEFADIENGANKNEEAKPNKSTNTSTKQKSGDDKSNGKDIKATSATQRT